MVAATTLVTSSVEVSSTVTSSAGSVLALVSLLVFVAGYSVGFGPGTWLLLSELFPAYIKGRAVALSTSFNWGTNLIVSATFLDFISLVGASTAFWTYGVVCGLAVVFVARFVPETKDRTLEDISSSLHVDRQQRQGHGQGQRHCWLFPLSIPDCSPGGASCCCPLNVRDVATAASRDSLRCSVPEEDGGKGSASYEPVP
jgi:MFS family permease